MIGRLRGLVEEIAGDFVILDVNGVGYQVYCLVSTLQSMKLGEKYTLQIEMQVREDSIKLFGFKNIAEKEIFLLLQSVNGVGAKTALTILSQVGIDQLHNAISNRDKNSLIKVQGIGSKTADRIILELKNHKIFAAPSFYIPKSDAQDAVAALMTLGISRNEAIASVEQILLKNSDAKIDDIIKQALTLRNK